MTRSFILAPVALLLPLQAVHLLPYDEGLVHLPFHLCKCHGLHLPGASTSHSFLTYLLSLFASFPHLVMQLIFTAYIYYTHLLRILQYLFILIRWVMVPRHPQIQMHQDLLDYCFFFYGASPPERTTMTDTRKR